MHIAGSVPESEFDLIFLFPTDPFSAYNLSMQYIIGASAAMGSIVLFIISIWTYLVINENSKPGAVSSFTSQSDLAEIKPNNKPYEFVTAKISENNETDEKYSEDLSIELK